jgi:hypothetical protein
MSGCNCGTHIAQGFGEARGLCRHGCNAKLGHVCSAPIWPFRPVPDIPEGGRVLSLWLRCCRAYLVGHPLRSVREVLMMPANTSLNADTQGRPPASPALSLGAGYLQR